MAIKFTTTEQSQGFIKCLVYGASGIGKTKLSETAPNPVIISSEKKLLSLRNKNIPVILIENHMDLEEAYRFLTNSKKASKFVTIVIDSISDIAESVLAYFKENPPDGNTHPQAAYGALADALLPLIKKFRDIPERHVYVIAKEKRYTDDYTGITSWAPLMPGQQLGPGLPYLFDFVFPMRIKETKDGKKFRYLQTVSDLQYMAKGIETLNKIEKPHLGELFKKALSDIEEAEVIEEEETETKLEKGFNAEEHLTEEGGDEEENTEE